MVERGKSRKGVIQKPKSDSLVPLTYNNMLYRTIKIIKQSKCEGVHMKRILIIIFVISICC